MRAEPTPSFVLGGADALGVILSLAICSNFRFQLLKVTWLTPRDLATAVWVSPDITRWTALALKLSEYEALVALGFFFGGDFRAGRFLVVRFFLGDAIGATPSLWILT